MYEAQELSVDAEDNYAAAPSPSEKLSDRPAPPVPGAEKIEGSEVKREINPNTE